MKNGKVIPFLWGFVLIFIYFFSLFGVLTNKYNISYKGFAVDSTGNIYIGFREGEIKKFKDGKQVSTLFAPTSRGYDFTITENDTLYIDCGDRAYYIDFEGNIIDEIEGVIPSFSQIRPDRSIFVTNEGVIYEKQFNFGRTKIVKYEEEKETVYEMPLSNYCIKLIVVIGSLVFLISILSVIIKQQITIRTNQTNY